MKIFLRITALLSLAWVVVLLFFRRVALGPLAEESVAGMLANGLIVAHIGWAFLFWRGASDPSRERTVLYTALVVLSLRAVVGTYEVLYLLHGPPAVLSLIDMVVCLGLFVGIINTLPGTLRDGSVAGAGGRHDT